MDKSLILLAVVATAISLQMSHREFSSSHEAALDLAALRTAELAKHNADRALHRCPSISLNDNLNAAAQAHADYLATNHVFSHSSAAKNGTYGENLYWGWGYPSYTYKSAAATDSWYAENVNYNYQTGASKTGKVIGHFTALVWKSVTSVGFGYALVPEKGGYAIYVVANYSPTPNVRGKYVQNVPAPI